MPKTPTIDAVAREIRLHARGIAWCHDTDCTREDHVYCDVRLQVYADGAWAVRIGPSDYDQDHRGHWGAGSIPRGRFSARDLARDLIEQVREARAEGE